MLPDSDLEHCVIHTGLKLKILLFKDLVTTPCCYSLTPCQTVCLDLEMHRYALEKFAVV